MAKQLGHNLKQLSNDLTILQIPMPGVASVAVLVLVGVGSRYETEKNMGLAHFYEHLSVMGTEKYSTNLDFTLQIENVGADFNAFTGEEYTGFYIKTEGRNLPLALEMLSQLIVYPLLKQSEIERERTVISEEINMREDTPQIKVADRMVELLFSGSGLGLPGAGTKESIATFSQPHFLELKQQHYVGSNMVLAIAGNIDHLETIQKDKSSSVKRNKDQQQFTALTELVYTYFKDLPSGSSTEPEFYINKQTQSRIPTIEIINKPTDQVHLAMGFQGFSRNDPERYAQGLLSIILGSGFSSRLFQKIRQEKSLAYSIGSDSEHFVDTGLFAIQAGLDKSRLKEAIRAIWCELQAIKGQNLHSNINSELSPNITGSELRKAKDYLRGKLVLRLEDPLNLAMYYGGQQLLENKILTWEQVLEEIEKVTISDIERVAKSIFDIDRMSLAIVGQKIEKSEVEKWLRE